MLAMDVELCTDDWTTAADCDDIDCDDDDADDDEMCALSAIECNNNCNEDDNNCDCDSSVSSSLSTSLSARWRYNVIIVHESRNPLLSETLRGDDTDECGDGDCDGGRRMSDCTVRLTSGGDGVGDGEVHSKSLTSAITNNNDESDDNILDNITADDLSTTATATTTANIFSAHSPHLATPTSVCVTPSRRTSATPSTLAALLNRTPIHAHLPHSHSNSLLPPTPPSSDSENVNSNCVSVNVTPNSAKRNKNVTPSPTSSSSSHSHSSSPSSSTSSNCNSNLISIAPKNVTNGAAVVLTEEEKRTLVAEGYSIPQRYPLTKQEERSLKKVRRKIKNKISAQESRRKKKEYLEELERRVHSLDARVKELERENKCLSTALNAKLTNGTTTTTTTANANIKRETDN